MAGNRIDKPIQRKRRLRTGCCCRRGKKPGQIGHDQLFTKVRDHPNPGHRSRHWGGAACENSIQLGHQTFRTADRCLGRPGIPRKDAGTSQLSVVVSSRFGPRLAAGWLSSNSVGARVAPAGRIAHQINIARAIDLFQLMQRKQPVVERSVFRRPGEVDFVRIVDDFAVETSEVSAMSITGMEIGGKPGAKGSDTDSENRSRIDHRCPSVTIGKSRPARHPDWRPQADSQTACRPKTGPDPGY